MQLTGHAGRHLSHPLHSSGRITTSAPWLKIAPKCVGQARRHASQLMHSSISIRTGAFFHFGLRVRVSMRSALVAPTARVYAAPGSLTGGSGQCFAVPVTIRVGDSSTGPRTHTEQGLERKLQLLDAATTLFSSKGYAHTRIADICSAAGVAKGLFYWYFPTKESLFSELVRTMRTQLRRAQAAAMDPSADPVTRIRQGTEASVIFMAEHRSYFALLDVKRADDKVASLLRDGSDV